MGCVLEANYNYIYPVSYTHLDVYKRQAFDCIYGSITDDDDSKVSDHHKIEMGGQFKGACYSESIQCIYYVHAETVFCITSQGTGRCGKDRRLFLFQIVLEY